jgi:hypothetical protein
MQDTLVWTDTNENRYQKARIIMRVTVGSDVYDVDITKSCEIWTDVCGFTISGEKELDIFNPTEDYKYLGWFPYRNRDGVPAALQETNYLTLLHNALRMDGTYRLELHFSGTIEDDKAVQATLAKQAGRAMPLLSTLIRREPQFQKVRTEDDLSGTEDTRDDSALVTAFATKLRDSGEDELGMGSITVPYLTRDYRTLLSVTGTTQRVIDFDVDAGGNLNYPLIVGITWRFGDTEATELKLDSNLLETL